MTLLTGTRLGPYAIENLLGKGGMGEVYRARDTRLDRHVAIKVLHHGIDTEAHRARFRREAKVISALDHPHICAIHDIGVESGLEYLVLELLEGETLAARLARGPLPISQVVRIGSQIADALAAAHQHGIIHRDLKPGNIMLTSSGVKLLDFGLAKALAPLVSDALATTVVGEGPATAEGAIVGTLRYMAPEQVQGLPTDTRTDIFALGLVLFEMATSRSVFDGSSQARVMASILDADAPRLSSLVPLAPPALEQVIDRCVAKEPADRWQSAHDVKLQLEWLQSPGSGFAGQAAVTPRRRWPWLLPLSTGLAGAALATAIAMLWLRPVSPAASVPMQFDLVLSGDAVMEGGSSYYIPRFDVPEMSPDGRRIAYAALVKGRRELLVRELTSREPTVVVGGEGAMLPFWAPDSRSLGFFAGGALKRISITGGTAQVLAPAATGGGGTWGNGFILFATRTPGGLHRIPEDGGPATIVRTSPPLPKPGGYVLPRLLPDGKTFLVSRLPDEALYVASLEVPGIRKLDVSGGPWARFAQGHLLLPHGGRLFARPFDLERLEFSGPEVPIGEPARSVSASDDGTVVYHAQPPHSTRLTWFTRTGDRTSTVGDARQFVGMALSPSARRAAVWYRADATNADIWEVDLATGVTSRMTSDPAWDSAAAWSPDERQVAFTSMRSGKAGVHVKHVVSGREELIATMEPGLHVDGWTPDGRFIVARSAGNAVYLVSPGDRTARQLVDTPYIEDECSVSPDGRRVAFNSDESGTWEVYIAAFPDFTSKRQISIGGGVQPRWRGDGRELFYLRPDASMMSVPVVPGTALQSGSPSVLFRTDIQPNPNHPQYAVTADGQRFLGLSISERTRDTFTVLVNWLKPAALDRQTP